MERLKQVVITGANGFVGRNVGKFLSKNGFNIIPIVRKNRKRSITFGKAIVSKNLLEDHLLSEIKNSGAMLHFIGQGRQTVDSEYEKINVNTTRNAIQLCKKASIKKIVYISGLGVDKKSTLGYFISKYKAEQEIIKSGLDYTILRASHIIGKDDPLSKTLNIQIRRGMIIIAGSGNYRIQPIFVEDVAKVIMKSITEKKFFKKILDLVGVQTVTYNHFVKDFAQGRKIRIRNIDFESAYRDALHNKGPFGVDDLSILAGDYVGDHKKLKRISGIKFRIYKDVLESRGLS
ncbi:MAG: NAD-dependent epimerase/dehydratase family protein [Thaumarchaeota archaeon]|nr:MAG: NAD-dependent epimerase/dehydratase family protein [Nitrososphaerota archaeon]